jgi:hypothetical protein
VYVVLRAQKGTETLEAVSDKPVVAESMRDERRKFEAELQLETSPIRVPIPNSPTLVIPAIRMHRYIPTIQEHRLLLRLPHRALRSPVLR